jgi:hypothetical protein
MNEDARMLQRLIYFSEINDLGDSGVVGLLEQVRTRNREDELTGMLLMTRKYFMQYLEGPRLALNAAYVRIAGDSRHSSPALLEAHDLEDRLFPDWGMGYTQATPRMRQVLLNYAAADHFEPSLMSSQAAVNLFWDIRALDLDGITPWRPAKSL